MPTTNTAADTLSPETILPPVTTASTVKANRELGPQTQRLSLDGVWRFRVEGETEERTIPVPSPWEAVHPDLRDRPVTATYTRTVQIPASWAGSGVVRLHVGAADYYSEVSVNGYLVGVHEGGYTPFDLEIQEFLRAGEENTISLKVMDGAPARMVSGEGDLTPEKGALQNVRPFPFTEIPHGKQSWYGTVGGIWQSVYLEKRPDTFVDNVFVRPDVANGGASVRIRIAHPPLDPAGYVLRLLVEAPKGAAPVLPIEVPLPAPRAEIVNVALLIPGAALWDTEHPNLYGLRVELCRSAKPVDVYETRFGMRSVEAKNGNILLNGTPIFIAGALDQDFYPGTIYTPPSTDYLRDQFKKAKEMGLNLLRCHIKTPDPRYLQLCDEMGLLVWYEIPNWAVLTKKSAARGREHLEAMLERDYNHASIVIVSVMNESWGIDLTQKWQREWLVDMFDYAKSLDPTRLFVDNSACVGNYHVKSDIDDYHVYYAIPDHADKWAAWCADFASRPKWTYTPYGDAQRDYQEVILLSEFGNWGLPKLSLLKKGYGGEEPWWFKTGAGSARPEGVAERFTRYGLDQIWGTYDRMAEVSQEQEWISLKFEIEAMRKHSSIVGYVITEFTDLHWESNGLLDMCRNPKVFHKRLASLQAQNLVIPDHKKTAYWSGERFTLPVLLSHFGEKDLSNAVLDWSVDGFPTLSGSFVRQESPAPIGSSPLGEIAFRVPDVTRAREVSLRLRLTDKNGALVNENYEKFAFFPAEQRHIELPQPVYLHDPTKLLPSARAVLLEAGIILSDRLEPGVLCLASVMDEKLLHFVNRGGAALLLTVDRTSLPRTTSGMTSVSRDKNGWWGDWCSAVNWFRPDGARTDGPWASLPQTRQFDFSFRGIVPRRVLVGWDPETEADDILAGLFLGWIGFPAAFAAGFRYGDGKVLCTTFELLRNAKTDPVSVVVLGDLLKYVGSSRFTPKKVAPMERVELSHTLIRSGEDGGATWRYTTVAPEARWVTPDFDDGAWKKGRSGFGRGLTNVAARTKWSSADIWLRLVVDIPEGGISQASLRYFHDDDFELFVNGEPLLMRPGFTTDYEDLALAPDQTALFRPGKNLVCIHCMNVVGPQFVDIGMTAELQNFVPASHLPPTEPEQNLSANSAQVAERAEGEK
ncbi:MAG: hypothetical protein H7Z41_03385 [Cytophagales bacterium]|nr:hypothetical protein [Armatimonadota bacterium]